MGAAVEGCRQRAPGTDRAGWRPGDGGPGRCNTLVHLLQCAGTLRYGREPAEMAAAAMDRPRLSARHRGVADDELRDPAALGHRARHLSTGPAAHPCFLAHRARGLADG